MKTITSDIFNVNYNLQCANRTSISYVSVVHGATQWNKIEEGVDHFVILGEADAFAHFRSVTNKTESSLFRGAMGGEFLMSDGTTIIADDVWSSRCGVINRILHDAGNTPIEDMLVEVGIPGVGMRLSHYLNSLERELQGLEVVLVLEDSDVFGKDLCFDVLPYHEDKVVDINDEPLGGKRMTITEGFADMAISYFKNGVLGNVLLTRSDVNLTLSVTAEDYMIMDSILCDNVLGYEHNFCMYLNDTGVHSDCLLDILHAAADLGVNMSDHVMLNGESITISNLLAFYPFVKDGKAQWDDNVEVTGI